MGHTSYATRHNHIKTRCDEKIWLFAFYYGFILRHVLKIEIQKIKP